MKTMRLILVLLIAAGIALAQAPKKNGTATKKAATTTATPAPAAKTAAQAPKAASTAPKTPAPKAAVKKQGASPMTPKPPKKVAEKKPAPAPEPAGPVVAGRGKRDPFVSPVVARGPGPGPCAGGKRCLAIDQLTVRGVVKGPKGWIAIVENPAKKTYFLMDNDELYDGSVIKISGDGIIFKQNVLDTMGRTSTRQVERKLAPGPAV